MHSFLLYFSAWIEDSSIYPYKEHKAQMMKLGKPKNTFSKAVAEIDDYINDPIVRLSISRIRLEMLICSSF